MKISDSRIPYSRSLTIPTAPSALSGEAVSIGAGSGGNTSGAPSITGGTSNSSSLSSALWNLMADGASSDVLDEFSKWAGMTPAERMRAQYLEARGLTESDLQAMAPDKRAALEAEIRDAVKQELGMSEHTDPAERFRG